MGVKRAVPWELAECAEKAPRICAGRFLVLIVWNGAWEISTTRYAGAGKKEYIKPPSR